MATRVIISEHWRQYEEQLDRGVKRALGQAASVGIAAARATPTKYHIQSILAKVRATPVYKHEKGYRLNIICPDFRAIWFLFGTYQRRGKKLKAATIRRRESASGQARLAKHGSNKGVRPVRFLQRARRVAAIALLENLKRELR